MENWTKKWIRPNLVLNISYLGLELGHFRREKRRGEREEEKKRRRRRKEERKEEEAFKVWNMCMEISYRNYVFRMCKELCLGWGFFYLLVWNSPTFNNEVDWFSSVLGVALSCYMVVWFGCGPQWRKNLYRENVGV